MEVSPSDDVRRSNPLSILCGGVDMIEVVVGGDPANTWRLHENLLCAASSYFKAAVSSRFSEGLNKKVSLPMDDNVIFMLFVEWLYTRNFRVNNMRTLFHAYVLGDRLGAPGFTSRVLDNIYDGIQWYEVKPDEVIWVIENTMAASALQRLLIDTVAFKVLTGSLATFSSAEWEALAPVQNEILQSASKLSQWNVLQHQPRPMSRPPRTEYTDHHTIEQEYAHRPAIGEKHPDRPAIEAESRELDLEGPAPIFG
ncbi:hypothetical protein AJ80_04533 [Polytolypa hystricis UAMH7299]|uniref:BTB domain-containing protein n=1 Tax=Polytolypa hystricis (strain UAMH7299) TaxID=1447883 RepID=A0A2B7Y9E9_POLH7|nr:hypothetical protein AJ80_04533 [Polytolypa hystricis UAMH7299]